MCSMIFAPNDSPLAGRAGAHLTGTKIGERLTQEADTSVSLRVINVDSAGEAFEVQARGELQLGLLIGAIRNLQPGLGLGFRVYPICSANVFEVRARGELQLGLLIGAICSQG